MKLLAAMTAIIVASLLLFVGGMEANRWEKANDYPYGKLCDLYRNCN